MIATAGIACNCCGRLITPPTASAEHTYRWGIFEEPVIMPDGQRAAVRIAWSWRAVCAPCVRQIHQAHERRLARRRTMSHNLTWPAPP
jgi:hypothetical protein